MNCCPTWFIVSYCACCDILETYSIANRHYTSVYKHLCVQNKV